MKPSSYKILLKKISDFALSNRRSTAIIAHRENTLPNEMTIENNEKKPDVELG